MNPLPTEIWMRIIRICILDSNDWRGQLEVNRKLVTGLPDTCTISKRLVQEAYRLSFVCRRWRNLIRSVAHFKYIQVYMKQVPETDRLNHMMNSVVSSHPDCALHIYLEVDLVPELLTFIRSNAARIEVLCFRLNIPPSVYFLKLNDIPFPKLQYFQWSLMTRIIIVQDILLPPQDGSAMGAFILNNSSNLDFLWLNTWPLNSIHTAETSCGITTLYLDLTQTYFGGGRASLTFISPILKFCPNLKRLLLRTGRYLERSGAAAFPFGTHRKFALPYLCECTLDVHASLILEILYYVFMPSLEALLVENCTADSWLDSRTLRLASPLDFPNLTVANFDPLCPLLADFMSIPTFPRLRELTVSNEHVSDLTLRECNMFQHSHNLSFLFIRGSVTFERWVLRNLARHSTMPLQSVKVNSSERMKELDSQVHWIRHLTDPIPKFFLNSIRSLVLNGLMKHENEARTALETFQGTETLTLNMAQYFTSEYCYNLSILGQEKSADHVQLPRLKTLKIFFSEDTEREGREGEGQLTATRKQCEAVSKYLHQRVAIGHGLDTVIFSHKIEPQAAAVMKPYVREIIENGAKYADHQYHRFLLTKHLK